MKLQRSNKLLSAVFCLLAVVYSVSSQCCELSTAQCSWTGEWLNYPAISPVTLEYPHFWPTARSTDFMFIQDLPGIEVSETTFHVASQETVISFDYFFESPKALGINKLEVHFENAVTGLAVKLAELNVPNPGWNYDHTVVCDSSVDFCCGIGAVPCDGRIRVTSTVDVKEPQSLFAFDRIGTCKLL
ncbi:hypothetical protein CHUAL_008322 [Chamberlinius hualienensis]